MNRAIELVHSDAKAVLENRAEMLAALRGQHIFISGGAGFLGIWLIELFKVLNEQHAFNTRLTVFSRHATTLPLRWPHLGQLEYINYENGDIRYLGEIPRDTPYVIHAAALTDRRLLASIPSLVAEINGLGTLKILQAAGRLENLKKFILLSSGLVYGKQPWDMPLLDETYSGNLPTNSVGNTYAESKRYAEIIAQCAISESKLPIVILRPFAFVGPYQSLQLPWAITDFMRDSLNGGPLRIMGDGSTVRSLMYASDYAFWVLAALANAQPNKTYNIGSPEAVSLGDLAQMITQFFSPVPRILTRVGQSGHERTRSVPSVDKIMNDLGVRITVPLARAVERSISWNKLLQSK